jgi:predicted O-methyltransferase YrrM
MGLLKNHKFIASTFCFDQEKKEYLVKLFSKARREYFKLFPFIIRYGMSRLTRKPLDFKKFDMSDMMISIDPSQGLFLYQQILLKKPQVVFEFGLSHGISTLYMAQALERLNQGVIFSSETESNKVHEAQKHLKFFNLRHRVNILAEDVLTAIDKVKDPIDLVHMDGFPAMNLEVLKKLESKLTPDALIITDDATLFNFEMQEYINYLKGSRNYSTTLIKNSTGVLYSLRTV